MKEVKIGIIGGSGLYEMADLSEVEEVKIDTPFGEPSDHYIVGTLEGKRVAFLARHGRTHRILPSELNFRANIYGLKKLGVERIISVSAVGSLKLEHKPLDIMLPDQFFDRTRERISTFFGNGIVAHVGFAEPTCPDLMDHLQEAGRLAGFLIKKGGTYLCIEGPAFSTKAESQIYRSWGMDVIGMTNLQEARLAREAEMCYATMALVTDYDCWYEEVVTRDMILTNLKQNSKNAQKIIRQAMKTVTMDSPCRCRRALEHAIFTPLDRVPEATKRRLGVIVCKYAR